VFRPGSYVAIVGGRVLFQGGGGLNGTVALPLCPYPQHAHYKGAGNPEDAASFECR